MNSEPTLDISGHKNIDLKSFDGDTASQLPLQGTVTDSDGLITPSADGLIALRHIGSRIGIAAYIVAIFSGMERFAFQAFSSPLQNYIQNPPGTFERPGALGLGQSSATALNCLLKLLSYITPMFIGLLADGRWGPYKTLVISCCIYLCGLGLLLLTSVPPALKADAGLGGLVASFIFIGLGIGGVKSSVAPFTADQVQNRAKHVATLSTGEKVIVDHDITVRKVYSIYYWAVNAGSLSGLVSTSIEKYVGFWASFLLAAGTLLLDLLVLITGKAYIYRRKPQKNLRSQLFRALYYAIAGGFRLDAAEPSFQLEMYSRRVAWDTEFVEDLRQAMRACRVWTVYPIVWLCFNQNSTNLVSQAGQMITYGIPNDAFASLNPLCVLVFVPLLELGVYPFMHKIKLSSGPITRMTIGFGLTALSMALAAGSQHAIYKAPPCYSTPRQCSTSDNGTRPNEISVFITLPVHIIGALGEVLWSVSGSEYAYNMAAPHMKSTLQAATTLTVAFSAALGLAVSPAARDPHLVIMFSCFAGVMAITTVVFGFMFHGVQ